MTEERKTSALEPRTTDGKCSINSEFLLGTVENDVDLLRELVMAFDLTYPSLLENLRNAIVAASPLDIRGTIHQLEGMMASLGATCAVALLRKMGALARQGQLQPLPALLQQLVPELERVKSNLDAILARIKSSD